MPRITYQRSLSGVGSSNNLSVSRTSNAGVTADIPVPKGKAGNLTTRTNNTVGTLTMGAGHGITTDQVFDLYWEGGSRVNVIAGTVSGLSVPIFDGTGDNLPADEFAIVASAIIPFYVPLSMESVFNFLAFLLVPSTANSSMGRVTFYDLEEIDLLSVELENGVLQVYDIDGGDETPFVQGGDSPYIVSGRTSNGSSAYDSTFRFVCLFDAVDLVGS